MKLQARIRYCENYDNSGFEGYAIEIWNGKEWGLDTFYPMVIRDGDVNCEKNFIHFSIIPKLWHMMDCGYEIGFCN